MQIIRQRMPIEKALTDPHLSEQIKNKLRLAIKAKEFAEKRLGLKTNNNYSTYVQLDRPYVTYVVSAAPRFQLKNYLWSYPFVGDLPYRGFFEAEKAKSEGLQLEEQGFDVFVRGVTAYSSLGWLEDPILSSMLRGPDADLVNTIIHESVHATLYIRSQAEFNEQLATFIGNIGTEIFYREIEGPESKTLMEIQKENHDQQLLSQFLSTELQDLELWYKQHTPKEGKTQAFDETARKKRLQLLVENFQKQVQPKLLSTYFQNWPSQPLNNAHLLAYQLYFKDLSRFEKIYTRLGHDFSKFLNLALRLEKSQDPIGEFQTAAP